MSQEHPADSGKALPSENDRTGRLWFSPAIMLATLLLVFGLIIWFTEGNNRKAKQNDLSTRTKTFSGTLQLILEGNESYLSMLAFERSAGELSPSLFQQRASEYVQAHPELINITWVDADFLIREVAPLAPNRQIVGLKLNLPEPKRVSRLARELRQPVYTRPFEAIQGKPSFEVWVPVYKDDTFQGLFGGVYSCERLLDQLISHTRPRLYYLSLTDRTGRLLAGVPRPEPLDRELVSDAPVTSEESGILLRVTRYREPRDWRLDLLKLLSLLLVAGMGYTLWKLKREIDERRRVEVELSQQAVMLEQEVRERQAAQENLQEQAALLEEEIGERWQAEEALKGSEEKLRLLLDSTGEGIYGIDLDGRCTFCNSACLKMLKYDHPDQLLGKNTHDQIHHSYPDGAPMPRKACRVHQTLGENKGSHVDSEVFWRSDRSSFPVEYWSYPQIKGGKVVGAVVAFIDISERKQLEEQFRQSQKMESVGRLAGGVAHDFNNMLSVILGAADLCKRKIEDDEPITPYLELIANAARRSSDITRQLLAFSRKEVNSPKPVDLNQLIEESNKILSRLISEDIVLAFHPADRLWIVMIDPSQVDQILMNLAVNARDAMPRGGSLTIETANRRITSDYAYLNRNARPGDYVQLTVSDTGLGMDKKTMEHIFEPFFTTKGVGKGTGLGLATVYGIVRQNNGFINVYSEPGHGSTFQVNFPRYSGASEIAEPMAEEEFSGSGTVLLVEDDPLVREMSLQMLQEIGYTVIEAETPEHALEICADDEVQIDMILTDVVMPGMNGKELVAVIESLRPGLKVLFMSGYTSDLVAQRGVVDEGRHFIQKPFDMHSLAGKIKDAREDDAKS